MQPGERSRIPTIAVDQVLMMLVYHGRGKIGQKQAQNGPLRALR